MADTSKVAEAAMLIFGVVAMEPMPLKASLPPLIVVGPVKVLAPERVQVPVPALVREVMLTSPALVMTSPCKTLAAALKVTPLVVRDVGLLMETMVVFAGMLALLITLPTTKPSTEASNRVVLVVLAAMATVDPVVVLSTIAPPISPVPDWEPCNVTVWLPIPVAVPTATEVTPPLNFSKPLVADWSSVAPPVLPIILRGRSVVLAGPV